MLKKWLISIVVNTIAIMAVAELFERFTIDSVTTAILASIILGILNTIVKPILVLFTLPITVLTLGLFLFVINAITLMLTQWILGDAFVIDGFGTALLAAVIIATLNALLQKLFKEVFD